MSGWVPDSSAGAYRLKKSKAAQEKTSCACEDLFLGRAIGQHACNLNGSDHSRKDHKESALFIASSLPWHKGKHSIFVLYKFGKYLAPHPLAGPTSSGDSAVRGQPRSACSQYSRLR